VQVEQVHPYLWRIPKDARPGMRVPGLIYADETLMAAIRRDLALEQVANAATLPGIVKASLAMPDIHQGYGLPVGGVVATDAEDGVVSPGGVGYDINCGVRLLRTDLAATDIRPHLDRLIEALAHAVPSGVGSTGRVTLSVAEVRRGPAREGAQWTVAQGYGEADELARMESHGRLPGADPDAISSKAYERGRSQLGTLGSGNHFLEVQVVETVLLPDVAAALGLYEGCVTVMIHTGSRGFGHQVCTDALGVMQDAMRRYRITLPDRQLACAPLASPEAQAYLGGMRAAANFAFANRQCLAYFAREAMERALGVSPRNLGWRLVYDVAHNIAKEEVHEVDGRPRRLLVHRKGATRAFPPGHPELPSVYRAVGQPVLIPGDMGRYSYVLVGAPGAMRETFGSTCHGAGRVLSRTAAVRAARGRSIADEDVVEQAGLSRVVARLRPLGVVKG
jgi:tRNA-splicing ligase RtcB